MISKGDDDGTWKILMEVEAVAAGGPAASGAELLGLGGAAVTRRERAAAIDEKWGVRTNPKK